MLGNNLISSTACNKSQTKSQHHVKVIIISNVTQLLKYFSIKKKRKIVLNFLLSIKLNELVYIYLLIALQRPLKFPMNKIYRALGMSNSYETVIFSYLFCISTSIIHLQLTYRPSSRANVALSFPINQVPVLQIDRRRCT